MIKSTLYDMKVFFITKFSNTLFFIITMPQKIPLLQLKFYPFLSLIILVRHIVNERRLKKMKSFKKVMATLFWIIKKGLFGFVAFYAFNLIGTFIGIKLVSNYLSYFLIGTLGLPGLLIVYIVNLLF